MAAGASAAPVDASLSWDDIPWLQSITILPIILKGVQTGEDAVLAMRAGVQGIVVSNHGGQHLDFARSAIEALADIMVLVGRNFFSNEIGFASGRRVWQEHLEKNFSKAELAGHDKAAYWGSQNKTAYWGSQSSVGLVCLRSPQQPWRSEGC